ncbi:hypothetical protein RUM43_011742 [Polyplax serrata]|uniref:Uncharacterized protein n=1 Tax=Polyplax serrata TaxID=468196 RepID=A0AAN8P1H3_POLSC
MPRESYEMLKLDVCFVVRGSGVPTTGRNAVAGYLGNRLLPHHLRKDVKFLSFLRCRTLDDALAKPRRSGSRIFFRADGGAVLETKASLHFMASK